jgi:hypothetical protein
MLFIHPIKFEKMNLYKLLVAMIDILLTMQKEGQKIVLSNVIYSGGNETTFEDKVREIVFFPFVEEIVVNGEVLQYYEASSIIITSSIPEKFNGKRVLSIAKLEYPMIVIIKEHETISLSLSE